MSRLPISVIFPENSRLLLTGGGKDFIERIGVEAAKKVVLGVLLGENVRTQTEPLTRQRIAQLSGAMVALFVNGWKETPNFSSDISALAVEQINNAKKNDSANLWPAQWLLGLTGKSVQNVLRSDPAKRAAYIADFESAIREASAKCKSEMGDLRMTLGFMEDAAGNRAELGWEDITRLTTAIGSLTLTIRGSDKSIYGKLFERLVLGSALALLGFQRVNPAVNTKTEKVFWLSDSADTRECDATLLLSPGRLARFDIGFIGPGNSEISKDKLTRYAAEIERHGKIYASNTFIIVDRLPDTSKTRQVAEKAGAELIQMSMQFWLKDLALRLGKHYGYTHPVQRMADREIAEYIAQQLAAIPIQDFLIGVRAEYLQNENQNLMEETI